MSRRRGIALALVAPLALGLGCGSPPPRTQVPAPAPAPPELPEPPPDPDVIATYDGGVIRVADVDRHIMALPRQRRMPADASDPKAWLERVVSNVFITRVVDASKEEPPEAMAPALRSSRRRALASELARRSMPPMEVTPEEVAARFHALKDELQSEEKRELSNILVAFPPQATAADREQVRLRVEGLRQQVRGGASFEALAREHSTSSSAAAGGSVGIVTRKMLRPEIADVVFALSPGEPSEVVSSEAGCQLFLVRQVFPAMSATLDSMADSIGAAILRERQAEWLLARSSVEAKAQGATLLPWPDRGYPEGFGDDTIVLEVGGERVLGREVRQAAGSAEPRDACQRLVADLLFSRALERDHPEVAAEVARRDREQAIRAWRNRRELQRYVESIPVPELERYYQDHRTRFMSDPEVELTILSWPIVGDPLDAMKGPRDVARRLQSAADPGKVIEEATGAARRDVVPLGSVRGLAKAHPEISAQLLSDYEQGSVIGPYRAGRRLLVVRVDTLVPARQLSFAEARERVLAAFSEDRQVDLDARFRKALAEKHGLVVHPGRVEGFGRRLLQNLLAGKDGTPPAPRS